MSGSLVLEVFGIANNKLNPNDCYQGFQLLDEVLATCCSCKIESRFLQIVCIYWLELSVNYHYMYAS